LSFANLSNANLSSVTGNGKEIKSILATKYKIAWSNDVMAIGYEQHSIKDWLAFNDATIAAMDDGALAWWKVWKPILETIFNANEVLI